MFPTLLAHNCDHLIEVLFSGCTCSFVMLFLKFVSIVLSTCSLPLSVILPNFFFLEPFISPGYGRLPTTQLPSRLRGTIRERVRGRKANFLCLFPIFLEMCARQRCAFPLNSHLQLQEIVRDKIGLGQGPGQRTPQQGPRSGPPPADADAGNTVRSAKSARSRT